LSCGLCFSSADGGGQCATRSLFDLLFVI
jgi:hypothetical protein